MKHPVPILPCDYCWHAAKGTLKGSTARQERLPGSGMAVLVTDHVLTEKERSALYNDKLAIRQMHRLCSQCWRAMIDLENILDKDPK